MQRAAAVGAFVAIGWVAHAGLGPMLVAQVVASTSPPGYVQDALMAHTTAIVRATMASQPEVPNYDPFDIRAATAIIMPTLPAHWRVTDVQLFPSNFGPSVKMAIEPEDFGVLSLFAVRPGAFDVIQPTALDVHDATAIVEEKVGRTPHTPDRTRTLRAEQAHHNWPGKPHVVHASPYFSAAATRRRGIGCLIGRAI